MALKKEKNVKKICIQKKSAAVYVALFVLLFLSAPPADSADMVFLQEGPVAAGMGGGFVCAGGGASALSVNPAGLAISKNTTAGVSGFMMAYDTGAPPEPLSYLNAGLTAGAQFENFGFSASCLKAGGRYLSDNSEEGYKLSAGFARHLWGDVYAGAAANVIIQTGKDGGVSFDGGLLYRPSEKVSFGITFKNAVASGNFLILDRYGSTRYTEYPLLVNAGFATRPVKNALFVFGIKNVFEAARLYTDIDVAAGYIYPNKEYTYKRSYHLGGEYTAFENVSFRAGVRGGEEEKYLPDSLYEEIEYQNVYSLFFGGGIKLKNFELNFVVENRLKSVNNKGADVKFSAGITGTLPKRNFIKKGGKFGGK